MDYSFLQAPHYCKWCVNLLHKVHGEVLWCAVHVEVTPCRRCGRSWSDTLDIRNEVLLSIKAEQRI